MLRLSVNRWGFTDKLFKINNLSVRRRGFTDEIHSVRQRLSGIAEVLTKKCGALRGMRQTQNWIESNNRKRLLCYVLTRFQRFRTFAHGNVKNRLTWKQKKQQFRRLQQDCTSGHGCSGLYRIE